MLLKVTVDLFVNVPDNDLEGVKLDDLYTDMDNAKLKRPDDGATIGKIYDWQTDSITDITND